MNGLPFAYFRFCVLTNRAQYNQCSSNKPGGLCLYCLRDFMQLQPS